MYMNDDRYSIIFIQTQRKMKIFSSQTPSYLQGLHIMKLSKSAYLELSNSLDIDLRNPH